MASAPYEERGCDARDEASRHRSVGEHVFIWIGWAIAAAFWGATMTTMVGIFGAVMQPTPGAQFGADAGGVAWLIIDMVGGMLLLGAALAYGSFMYSKRDRRLDPVSEVATARLYDSIERQGGEDMTSRSPDPSRRRDGIR